jgi:alpha-galactosidase/6-phospho-beta-glucosidase family protein
MAQSWLWNYTFPAGEMAEMADKWSRVHHSRKMGVCPIGA